jgi:hypothetical protein
MIFFIDLTDMDENKISINIAKIDYMQTINAIDYGDLTKLNIGNDAICVKESVDYIKERLHGINEHLRNF